MMWGGMRPNKCDVLAKGETIPFLFSPCPGMAAFPPTGSHTYTHPSYYYDAPPMSPNGPLYPR